MCNAALHIFYCFKNYGEVSKLHGSRGTSKYYPILIKFFVEFYFYEPNNLRGWEGEN